MKQTYTKLPNFISGQILKSNDLNDFFAYNEEQNRLTRSDLMPYGIVRGMDCRLAGRNIVVTQGCGVTPDGHLIHIDKEMILVSATPAEKGSKYDYVLHENNTEVKAASNIPDTQNYLLVLTSEYAYAYFPHCSQTNCDINAENKREVVRAYLLRKDKVKTPYVPLTSLPYVQTKCCSGFSGALNVNILNEKTQACFKTNKKRIAQGMFNICKALYPELTEASTRMMTASCWENVFHPEDRFFQRVLNVYKKFCSGWHDNLNEIPLYYLEHFEDMALAINAYIETYNEFAAKYAVIPTQQSIDENALSIGQPGQAARTDYYRMRIFPSDSLFVQDCKVLERLLIRIVLMSEKFIENYSFNGDMHIR